jgi:hypothetical protein
LQKKVPFFGITMGVKAYLSSQKLPDTIVLRNLHRYIIATQDGTGRYLIPYVAGFIKAGISF